MELVVISAPDAIANEHLVLDSLFASGLRTFHLRKKPEWPETRTAKYIEAIRPAYRNRVMLHSHHHLAARYRLKGVHYTETTRSALPLPDFGDLTVSTSFHQLEQLQEKNYGHLNYAFLSPIFDSISKEGYKAACFDRHKLKSSLKNCEIDVVALGGITKDNVCDAMELGFGGAAVLGSIWGSENPANAFTELIKACESC